MDDSLEPEAPRGAAPKIGRRDALKKGAIGAGVVGVVWAAPVIEGLAVTPAYGAAASAGVTHCAGNFDFNQPLPSTIHYSGSDAQAGVADHASPACATVTHTVEYSDVGPPSDSFSGGKVHITITKSNPACQFTAANFDGISGNFVGADQTDKTVTADKITATYVSDPGNFGGDLGHINPGGTAHIKITCI